MAVKRNTVKTSCVELDFEQTKSLVRDSAKIVSFDIVSDKDIVQSFDELRKKHNVSFGIGPNNTVYIMDNTLGMKVDQCYNLPINILYNGYLDEITVTEFFPKEKMNELDKMAREALQPIESENPDTYPSISGGESPFMTLRSYILDPSSENDPNVVAVLTEVYFNIVQGYRFVRSPYEYFPRF